MWHFGKPSPPVHLRGPHSSNSARARCARHSVCAVPGPLRFTSGAACAGRSPSKQSAPAGGLTGAIGAGAVCGHSGPWVCFCGHWLPCLGTLCPASPRGKRYPPQPTTAGAPPRSSPFADAWPPTAGGSAKSSVRRLSRQHLGGGPNGAGIKFGV